MSKNFVFNDGILWFNDGAGGMPVMAKGGTCPYCGHKHRHGGDSGHRLSHCVSGKPIRSPWTKWLDRSDGYYWMNMDLENFEALFEGVCEHVKKEMDDEIQSLLKP
jgi:hypothetical protein